LYFKIIAYIIYYTKLHEEDTKIHEEIIFAYLIYLCSSLRRIKKPIVKPIVPFVPIVVNKKEPMKSIILMISTIFLTTSLTFSQAEAVKIYNPEANAREDIAAAVKQAKAENKHVLLQIGGNWCPWCVKLHELEASDHKIDSLMNADYVRVMVNIPREKDKRDYELLSTLENPQRFGFPVLVILNQDGQRIHTQDSWYLEQDKDYDLEKLLQFFKMWTVAATL